MAKITIDIDTEKAIRMILGVSAILMEKAIATETGSLCPEWEDSCGFRVLEDALVMAAKAIDIERFGGSTTKSIVYVEGSAE